MARREGGTMSRAVENSYPLWTQPCLGLLILMTPMRGRQRTEASFGNYAPRLVATMAYCAPNGHQPSNRSNGRNHLSQFGKNTMYSRCNPLSDCERKERRVSRG